VEEQEMVARYPKTAGPAGPGIEKKTAEPQAVAGKDDVCRCKETSGMKPRELLKLMVSDLAFWKKVKKE
jgi:hypothetical protein